MLEGFIAAEVMPLAVLVEDRAGNDLHKLPRKAQAVLQGLLGLFAGTDSPRNQSSESPFMADMAEACSNVSSGRVSMLISLISMGIR